MSKKLKITIVAIIGALILVLAGVLLVRFVIINSRPYKEKMIKKELTNMTEEFYSYYYDENKQDKEITEYIAQFKDTGLSITLGDLKIYLGSRNNNKYDSKYLEKCDVANTIVTVKPKKPYGKKDYSVTLKVECK